MWAARPCRASALGTSVRPGAVIATVRALSAAALALACAAGRLSGQEGDSDPRPGPGVGPAASGDTALAAADPLPVPEKPPVHQFRFGVNASAFGWDDDAHAEDGLLAGFDLERDLGLLLTARAALAYGSTELDPRPDVEPLDTRVYLPEVSLLLQGKLGPLRDGPVVPFAILSFGSLITDPDRDGVSTRSQNAFGYGVGARLGLGDRLGVGAEVRRYLIKLESLFGSEAEPRSESIHNLRLGGSLTYAF